MAQPKHPPHSIEAEQSVLGGLMLDNRVWLDLVERVTDSDFYRADHQLIFHAINELIGANKPCDFVTLSEHLRHHGKLEEAGGMAYLGSLAVDTYSVANVLSYADIVRERSVLRQLIATGNDISGMGYQPDGRAPSELVDEAEQKVFAIRERGARGRKESSHISTLLEHVERRIELLRQNPNALAGLPTGFSKLDERTNGLHPGDLVIIAARPSMGKCLAHDTKVVLDDGSIATIEEFYRTRPGRIGTLHENLRIDRAVPSNYVDDGCKPVFEVTTRLGRCIETTLPHPFLTLDGWKPLAELKSGDHVAVPRSMPVFGEATMRECEIKLLAYLIGDGGLTGSSPRFTTTHRAIEREFITEVGRFGGCRVTEHRSPTRAPSFAVVCDFAQAAAQRQAFARKLDAALAGCGQSARAVGAAVGVAPATVTYWRQARNVPDAQAFARLCRVLAVQPEDLATEGIGAARKNANPLTEWLSALGLNGKGAAGKHIPAPVFCLPRPQLALFLNRLFATDGWASVSRSGQPQIGYATICEDLARQVQHLLLRFGIVAKLRLRWVRYREARRPAWQLEVTHGDSLRRFLEDIGIFGKEEAVARMRRALDGRRTQANVDLIPVGIWKHIEQVKGSMSWAELARKAGLNTSNLHVHRRGLSRGRLERFAVALDSAPLLALATGDVYWDRIESIVPAGLKQVYDLTMPVTHNFIANDFCVHNTSFAMNIAEHVAIQEKKAVAVFSMEMSGEQLAQRVLASFGRIELGRLRSGQLDDTDMSRLVSADSFIREAPLFIDETGSLSPLELRARARRLASKHDLKLVIVDYIQLMQVAGTRENRTNEISEISRGLKSLAKELALPVIALSQLNRAVEQRDNKRPRLADLRESGGIEQDADLVAFIYRDDVYNPESADKGTAEIIIGKQRNGPTGTIKTAFLGQYTRFDNLAAEYIEH